MVVLSDGLGKIQEISGLANTGGMEGGGQGEGKTQVRLHASCIYLYLLI